MHHIHVLTNTALYVYCATLCENLVLCIGFNSASYLYCATLWEHLDFTIVLRSTIHCICIELQCGGILRLECFLGANLLPLQYNGESRGAALPPEPRKIMYIGSNTVVGTAHFPCHVGFCYNAHRLFQPLGFHRNYLERRN